MGRHWAGQDARASVARGCRAGARRQCEGSRIHPHGGWRVVGCRGSKPGVLGSVHQRARPSSGKESCKEGGREGESGCQDRSQEGAEGSNQGRCEGGRKESSCRETGGSEKGGK